MKKETRLRIKDQVEYLKYHAQILTTGNLSHHRNVIIGQCDDILGMLRCGKTPLQELVEKRIKRNRKSN